MTNIRAWAISAAAVIALVAGVLVAGGALTFAQTDSPTPTPAPSAATPAPSGGSATPAPSPSPGTGSGTHKNCPNMGLNGGSSGSQNSGYRSGSSSARVQA